MELEQVVRIPSQKRRRMDVLQGCKGSNQGQDRKKKKEEEDKFDTSLIQVVFLVLKSSFPFFFSQFDP